MSNPEKIEHNFKHHAPSPEKVITHEQIRAAYKSLALFIDGQIDDSREKSLAITKLEEAMFWANAGIARNNAK